MVKATHPTPKQIHELDKYAPDAIIKCGGNPQICAINDLEGLYKQIAVISDRVKYLENTNNRSMDTSQNSDMAIRRPYSFCGNTYWITANNEQEYSEKVIAKHQELMGFSYPTTPQKTNFAGFATSCWDNVIRRLGKKTAEVYTHNLEAHLLPYFGKMSMEDIKPSNVQDFINTKSHLAKKTVRNIAGVLSCIFNMAVREDIVEKNVVTMCRYNYPHRENRREEAPIDLLKSLSAQIARLPNKRDRIQIALVAFTGMRRGEICALKWSDIDWKNDLIRITEAVGFVDNQPFFKGTKTDAGTRTIPLLTQLREVLEPLKREIGLVLCKDDGTPMTEKAFEYGWERIGKIIDLQSFTPHSFRHTMATILASSKDISLKTGQAFMGHSDMATFANRYAHQDVEATQKAGYYVAEFLAN